MAATPLLPVGVEVHPLDVIRRRDGDEHGLVLDQILGREIARVEGDLRPAGVAELQCDLGGLAPDLVLDVCLAREDRLEPADLCFEIVLLIRYLPLLKRCEPAELHLEDRICLGFVKAEPGNERDPCIVDRVGSADCRDDLIDVRERDEEAV